MKRVTIDNFKCISHADLRLGSITLLCGVNGAGKSSVFQSILALKQSYESGDLSRGMLSFAGNLVDIGSAGDVLFEGASDDTIGISFLLSDDDEPVNFQFHVSGDLSMASALPDSNINTNLDRMLNNEYSRVLLTSELTENGEHLAFQYLQAERNGPRKFLPMSGRRRLDLGTRGEYVLQALFEHQDVVLFSSSDPRQIAEYGVRLRDQLEAWLSEISPNARLEFTPVSQADLIVGGFSFEGDSSLRSKAFRATNVGFGLSYVLPVLVALLATPRGGLVLIENPEAHLHPRGQTKIGELCARAAAAGVKVLIETHSDHLMDGIRIAVREKILSPEQAAIHYFSRSGSSTSIVTPSIDKSGKLSVWPENFFDQHRRNSAKLLKPMRE